MSYRYCAFSPHHITAFFSPVYNSDILKTGSIGAGIAIEPGAVACTNGSGGLLTGTAERALRVLGYEGSVYIREPLSPGVGYAVSAATSISATLAASTPSRATVRKALEASHTAEVQLSTGLGDVLAISCGIGVVVRKVPGAPGQGSVDCFQAPGSIAILSLEWGKIPTARLIKELRPYYDEAKKSLERLLDSMSFEVFLEEAERFSSISKANNVISDLNVIRRTPGLIGFYTKKSVSVLFVEEDRVRDAVDHLEANKLNPRILEFSTTPPRVWVEKR